MPHPRPTTRKRTVARLTTSSALVTGLLVAGQVAGLSPAQAATTVTTWDQLTAAVTAGGTVQLGADITQPASALVVPANLPVVLDLESFTLDITPSTNQPAVEVDSDSDLTVMSTGGVGSLVAHNSIGSAYSKASGRITVNSGHVQAAGGQYYPGIGVGPAAGNAFPVGQQPITVNGGTVTATGGANSSGIGGGQGVQNAPTVINGGTVTAVGGGEGAGIGTGYITGATVAPGDITIHGGTVSATGGGNGAGIGGGYYVPGASVLVTGGAVTATAGSKGSAVGPGYHGSGGDVVLSGGGLTVDATASNSGVTTAYTPATTLASSFTNAAALTILQGSTLTVPPTGTFTNQGSIDLFGTIAATGTLTNSGTIKVEPTGGVSGAVTTHNYTVQFAPQNSSASTPAMLRAYAASLSDAGLALPTLTGLPSGTVFTGWFTAATGGNQVSNTSDLGSVLGTPGPGTITLYAHYATSRITYTTSSTDLKVDDTVQVTASASSGLPVAVSVDPSTSARCTVDAHGTVTGVLPGICLVDLDQAGDTSHASSPRVQVTLHVGVAKPHLTVTVNGRGEATVKVVDAHGSGMSGKVRFFLDGKVVAKGSTSAQGSARAKLKGPQGRALAAGQHRLVVRFNPQSAGYGNTSKSVTFTVS